MGAVSANRTLRVLQQGVNEVQRAVAARRPAGVAYARVQRLIDASRQIAWMTGSAPRGGPELQVIILDGAPPSHLNSDATFQANKDGDGNVRVYVQRRSYTPLWAGMSLFHELAHVLDYLENVWRDPNSIDVSEMWAGEARAYHSEALLIDTVIADGRLLPALDELSMQGLARLLTRGIDDIGSTLHNDVVPPRHRRGQEDRERGARNVALAFAAVLATGAVPRRLEDVEDLSGLGETLRHAAETWGFPGL